MTEQAQATELVEQVLAGWILRHVDVMEIEHIAQFLRAEDFANPLYGSIFGTALDMIEEFREAGSPRSEANEKHEALPKLRGGTETPGRNVVPADAAGPGELSQDHAEQPPQTETSKPGEAASSAVTETVPAVVTASAPVEPPTPDGLYARLLRGDEWRESLPPERLLEIEIQCPRTAAARDWARLIVEDSARRRVEALSFRVEVASQARSHGKELDLVRRHLQATLLQLKAAGSLVNGAPFQLHIVEPGFMWRENLHRLDPARPQAPPPPLTEQETARGESLALALFLQHPIVGREMVMNEEVFADNFRNRLNGRILRAMESLVQRGTPINSVSVFRELLSSHKEQDGDFDQERTIGLLGILERLPLPPAAQARVAVLNFVSRLSTEAAVEQMRTLSPKPTIAPAVLVDASLGLVNRVAHVAMSFQKHSLSAGGPLALPPGRSTPGGGSGPTRG